MTSNAILSPISAVEPCGPSLEYDHEFAMLRARLVPREDAQYGSFVGAPEALNWAEIERDCQRLLLRTKDINLLVWLCRARTRQGQAAGLAQMLGTMGAVLQTWPDQVHPQIVIEGERDPAVRANAIAGLVDPEGLLGDVGDLVVSASTALRLTVHDVERAFAIPRPADASDPVAVTQQLVALRAAAEGDPLAPVQCLAQAAGHLRAIDDWTREQLGDDAPSLRPLRRVLELFLAPQGQQAGSGAAADSSADPGVGAGWPDVPLRAVPGGTRSEVQLAIRSTRQWFESHEPSSPVAVLLKQAERMVGKRFSQVADAIPLDLLRRWDSDEGDERGAA
ncbi:type VI secretion system ImpA family N-terminal domain-containing protein [Variovorax sp. TBS-050B]|uniref:type VI secretion system protein TssA n=1 Tax=Variovorax sp. TBS-050B TaxID=2940551 RepID=UPI002475EB9D|nr:type VI secretion system ImpA family N-terminal domain-containing protein [Variovorax sp. TBS-050B]